MRWRRAPLGSRWEESTVAEAVDGPAARVAPGPGGIVVITPSRLRREGSFVIFGIGYPALLVFGASGLTIGGRVIAGVFGALGLVVLAFVWWVEVHLATRIEVSADRARLLTRRGPLGPDLIREHGPDLLLYRQRIEGQSSPSLTLAQVATSVTWKVRYFSRRAIADACTSCGWHVESRSRRDRRAFGRRVAGTVPGMGTVLGAVATEVVHAPNARFGPPTSDVTVVTQSHAQRDTFFIAGASLLGLALVNDLFGPGTIGDRVSGAVFFGVLIVGLVIGWSRTAHRKSRIEVSAARLRFVGKSSRPYPDLIRDQGADLVMYPRR